MYNTEQPAEHEGVAGAAPHTYASCQGLTLHNHVRLDLEFCHLTLR